MNFNPNYITNGYTLNTGHPIQPNAQELQAHEEVLKQIDKSSGGKTLWQRADHA